MLLQTLDIDFQAPAGNVDRALLEVLKDLNARGKIGNLVTELSASDRPVIKSAIASLLSAVADADHARGTGRAVTGKDQIITPRSHGR